MLEKSVQGLNGWSNWAGNQCFYPSRFEQPVTEDDLHAVVLNAIELGHSIRPVGAGHSFSPVVETSGVLVTMDNMRGVTRVNAEAKQFEAYAATRISELGDVLWANGLALENQGDIDAQAIAGAVSTGTHGSGRNLKGFSANLLGALLFDGRGERLQISDTQNFDLLPALQTSLGMLGCISRTCVRAVPAYMLEETIKVMPFNEVLERWDELLSNYRHFSFFWMPTEASASLYNLQNAKKDFCVVKLYNEVNPHEMSSSGTAKTDRSYKIYPSVFEPNFYEMEYFMPVEYGAEIAVALRTIMLSGEYDSRFPMEVRFVAADEAWLSPAYHRNSVVISISGVPGTSYLEYLERVDRLFKEYAGRPHWGKLHFMTRERVQKLFPCFDEFVMVRRQLDPNGIFLNSHLADIFI